MEERYLLLTRAFVTACLLTAGSFCFETTYSQSSDGPEVNPRNHDFARINIQSVPENLKETLKDSHQFDGWEKAKFYSDAKGNKYLVDFGPGKYSEREFLFDFNGDDTTLDAPPAPRRAGTGAKSTPSRSGELNTEGLTYAGTLQSIYAGDFQHVPRSRDSFEFGSLVTGFRRAFSENCAAALPKNKVEITENKCDHEEWRVNGFGAEILGSRHCSNYVAVGTGKYADPEVDEIANHLNDQQLRMSVRDLPQAMRDMAGYISSKAAIAKGARMDMNKLLTLNGCASSTTKRFQANLVRFGSGRQPIDSSSFSPMTQDREKIQLTPILAGEAWIHALYWPPGFQGNSDPVVKMLRTSDHPKGPMVLKCSYETQGGQRYDYFFWPSAPPANIKGLRAVDSTGVLRYLGTKSTQKCPETKEKALELRQAAMRESGFVPQ